MTKGSKLELIIWKGECIQHISQGRSRVLSRSRLQGEVVGANALAGWGAVIMRKDETQKAVVFYLFNKV